MKTLANAAFVALVIITGVMVSVSTQASDEAL